MTTKFEVKQTRRTRNYFLPKNPFISFTNISDFLYVKKYKRFPYVPKGKISYNPIVAFRTYFNLTPKELNMLVPEIPVEYKGGGTRGFYKSVKSKFKSSLETMCRALFETIGFSDTDIDNLLSDIRQFVLFRLDEKQILLINHLIEKVRSCEKEELLPVSNYEPRFLTVCDGKNRHVRMFTQPPHTIRTDFNARTISFVRPLNQHNTFDSRMIRLSKNPVSFETFEKLTTDIVSWLISEKVANKQLFIGPDFLNEGV